MVRNFKNHFVSLHDSFLLALRVFETIVTHASHSMNHLNLEPPVLGAIFELNDTKDILLVIYFSPTPATFEMGCRC